MINYWSALCLNAEGAEKSFPYGAYYSKGMG